MNTSLTAVHPQTADDSYLGPIKYRRIAFVLCALALTFNISDFLTIHPPKVSSKEIYHFIAPLAVAFFILAVSGQVRKAPWASLVPAAALFISSLLPDLSAVPFDLHIGVMGAALLMMVTYLRVGVPFYGSLAIASGILIAWRTGDPLVGLVGALSFGALLFCANYPIQMVLDHRNERERLQKIWRSIGLGGILLRSVVYWLPSALLVAGGVWINSEIQTIIIRASYDSGMVEKIPESIKSESSRTEFEQDVYYTINKREIEARSRYEKSIKERINRGGVTLEQVPQVVKETLDLFKPSPVNVDAACSGAVLKVRGFRIGSAHGFCGGIVRGIEASIVNIYERVRSSAIGFTNRQVDQAIAAKKSTETALLEGGSEGIKRFFDDIRTGTAATFLILLVISYVSYALLASALIGGYLLVVGRLLFNFKREKDGTPVINPVTFRLDRNAKAATALSYATYDQVNLKAVASVTGNMNTWYVSFGVTRIGDGTHMRLIVPQILELTVQRMINNLFFMTKIELKYSDSDATASNHGPRISLPGDLKLVCIYLDGTQDVVFQVKEMAAFSNGVNLSSVYTTHVAAHFFGLGSFYAIASGRGVLILRSDGSQVSNVEPNLSVTPPTLIAWDRRAEFSLAQQVSFSGIWFNDPSIVTTSTAGSAIADEGHTSGTGLLHRIGRLTRYLFMPF
ncbi:AIM24 family protein [Methylobacterium sp. CM6244]